MANIKVINADQLDTDMRSVADAIRERAGTSGELVWPEGFKQGVRGIVDTFDVRVANDTPFDYTNDAVLRLPDRTFHASKIIKASFASLVNAGFGTFYACADLIEFNAPNLKDTGGSVFYGCTALERLDFNLLRGINGTEFSGCSLLKTLVIRTPSLCPLYATNAFNNTPISAGTGYVYVPRSLVDSYRSASNWSNFASRFRALEDYTVDGTTTGAIDMSKI